MACTDYTQINTSMSCATTDLSQLITDQKAGYPTDSNGLIVLPVFGLPGSLFYTIHGVALASLSISIIASTSVIISVNLPPRSLWKRPVGERLVLYLALCDVFYSISHCLDHLYMLASKDHVPQHICVFFAFILGLFLYSQMMMVFCIAINSFVMVVREKRLDLGRYDWKLLLATFGVPTVFFISCAALDSLGPGGAWCFFDARKPLFTYLSNTVTFLTIIVFITNVLCYGAIWIKVKTVSMKTFVDAYSVAAQQRAKYIRTAKIMVIFILVYAAQWGTVVIGSFIEFVRPAPLQLIICNLWFINFGGAFNAMAYTWVKRHYRTVGQTDNSNMPHNNSSYAENANALSVPASNRLPSGHTHRTQISRF